MGESRQLLVFTIDDNRYALHLDAVERVVRAVAITPVSDLPEPVLGIINLQGLVVPVISLRRRFHLPDIGLRLNDQFIIASTANRTVALLVDAAGDVVDCPDQAMVPAEKILQPLDYVEGVMKLPDGMILIYDLETLLSLGEMESGE